MNGMKFRLIGIELICFLIWLPNIASAHTCRWPHRCERDYYNWLDKGRYIWLDRCQYSWNYCRPFTPTSKVPYYPHYPFRLEPYYPVVIEQPPVVIERRIVIRKPRKCDGEECELLKRIREKKSEWFKKIKEENKEERREAVENLSGFSFDPLVRAVLEKVLLSDPEPGVRKAAAKSLGKVNNWKVLSCLEEGKSRRFR